MPATIFYSKPEVIPWAWQHDTLDSASDTDCSIRLGWCCCRGMAVTGRNYHQLCPQEPWGRESHELMELTLLFSWLCKQFLITVIKKLSKTCSKKTFACSEGYLKWKRKKKLLAHFNNSSRSSDHFSWELSHKNATRGTWFNLSEPCQLPLWCSFWRPCYQ